MTSKRNVLAAVLASGALLTAAASFSVAAAAEDATSPPPPHGEWHHHGHDGMWHMYSKLGLTDEQKTSIKSIMTAAKPSMQSLHQKMMTNHLELMKAVPGSSTYSTTVSSVAASEATLAQQRTTQMEAVRAQIYSDVLTPTQRTQLATLQTEWAAKMQARGAPQE